MNRSTFNSIACCCGFFVLIVATFADLNGKWTGTIRTPDGNDIQAVYNFKVNGDTLTGTAESPEGVVTIDNGKVNGDNFSFKVTVDGVDYPHAGTVYKDSCSLDIDFGGAKVHTTLLRATGQIQEHYQQATYKK
jgi:hypothetical protein